MIDVGIDIEDHDSISHNYDWEEVELLNVRIDLQIKLDSLVSRLLIIKSKKIKNKIKKLKSIIS
jgi:hypothetical protein